MEQLTKEQAFAFCDSKEWQNWDDEKIVRFQLFQERLAIPFNRFHQALENVLQRPVYTHELEMNYRGIVEEYLSTRESPTTTVVKK